MDEVYELQRGQIWCGKANPASRIRIQGSNGRKVCYFNLDTRLDRGLREMSVGRLRFIAEPLKVYHERYARQRFYMMSGEWP